MAKAGSILAADFGSVHTRVVLVDVVDGVYRIVARDEGRTTLGFPVDDVGVGLQQLVSNLESITGRRIYAADDRLIMPEDQKRNGIDTFITTSSAGRPIRAVMVGLMPDISLMTALRAISGAYVEPVAQIHLRDGMDDESRLNAILLNQPDLIFISGGTEGGAKTALLKLLSTVRLAVRVTDPTLRPVIVYAGNARLNEDVKTLFGELTTLHIASNIRPDMEDEAFESVLVELGKAYNDHRETHSGSFHSIQDVSSSGVLPTAQSYATLAEYFGQTLGGNILAVDIGSTTSTLVGIFGGQSSARISTTKGLGHSAVTLLNEVGEDEVAAWLPFYPEQGEIMNYAFNKTVRPGSIPNNLRDLYLEHALLRSGLRQMMNNARELWPEVADVGPLPPVNLVLAGGAALSQTGSPAYNMLLIADCLQPTGITQIKTDPYGVVPAMGALARLNPQAAIHLLEGDGLDHLGTLVSIDGQPRFGSTVAKLTITTDDNEKVNYELKGGHILSLPMPQEYSLEIKIRTSGGHTIGGKRRLNVTLSGGTAGIIFDARGRTFEAPATVEERAAWLPQWVNEATDDPLQEIPEEWLLAPEALVIEPEPEVTTPDGFDSLAALAGVTGDEEGDFFDMIESEEAQETEDVVEDDDEEDDFDDLGDLRDLL